MNNNSTMSSVGMTSSRNLNIDFMRFIGLLLVILAHVQSPHWLHEIRCFDVPMMLFCSGLTCKGKSFGNYWSYIWKRTKRLVIPTYIFVIVFYVLFYLETYLKTKTFDFNETDFINTILFRNESLLHYLWIIKVFLLVMLITPFLVRLADKINSFWVFGLFLITLVLVQQGLVLLLDFIPLKIVRIVYREYFLYLTGYSILFLLGVKIGRINELNNKSIWLSLAFLLMVIVSYVSIYGLPFHLLSQQFKYPPKFWFVLYGAACSVTSWFLIRNQNLNSKLLHFCVWMGQNTIWLYLWHIIGLRVGWMVSDHWAIQWCIVLISSIAIFSLQYFIVGKINKPFFSKYFVG